MSRKVKLLEKLLKSPKDFTWDEAVTLLKGFDFVQISNSGSRRKFFHSQSKIVICIHKPHPQNVLKKYQIMDVIEGLKNAGVLSNED